MSFGVEALFTNALGLLRPWVVDEVKFDTVKRRVDFETGCPQACLAYPACGAATQSMHNRMRRSWRHLDFFQFEACQHCDVPRVACGGCSKTTQMAVPGARAGSGFTSAFEALVLPEAHISYNRFHVVSMAIEAMDQVRRQEIAEGAGGAIGAVC